MATLHLGPSNGSLTVRTDTAGPAARLGHRLLLAFDEWEVRAEVPDGSLRSLAVTVHMDSLRVRSGTGGATPLTPVDKQVIRRNALRTLRAKEYPTATFVSQEVEQTPLALRVSGDLTIAGRSKRVLTEYHIPRAGCVAGNLRLPQSAFGIKPYSLLNGTLRVADVVVVEVDLCAG